LLVALGWVMTTTAPANSIAQEPGRFALLIGNQGYPEAVGPLKNPHNDVARVGRALREVGFALLEPLKDATRDDMLFGVHDLAARLRKAGPGAIGFLYYTGHGVAVGADNVLLPKNVQGTSDAELNVRGVKLAEILDILKRDAPDAVHFVVLDACRNNIRGQRGAKGFASVSDQRTGVVLAFATAAGETASDEGKASGPYATALAEEIVKPGRNDQAVFNAVRARVVAATRRQTPWTHDGLIGERVVFKAKQPPRDELTYKRYIGAFEAGVPILRGSPFPKEAMGPLAYSSLETSIARFKGTRWQGGDGWGTIQFDPTGREATYTNDAASQSGRMLLQGVWSDAGSAGRPPSAALDPILVGEWQQGESRGGFILKFVRGEVAMLWGPRFLRESRWRKAASVDTVPPPANPVAVSPTPPAARCDGVALLVGNERRCVKQKEGFRDCPGCPEMVVAPAGRFTMGSPKGEPERLDREDQVAVTIAKPFAVGRFAVTRGEFAAFVKATGRKLDGGCYTYAGAVWQLQAQRNWQSPGFAQDDRHPVICVNWSDAKAYASWLSSTTGKAYRLPSEAEREYVARAGTTTPFWWGAAITTKQANYNGKPYAGGAAGEFRKATVPVDAFAPNPWGLYNVHGNVWEWTEDCRSESHAGNPGDGSARTSGDCQQRAVRGGAWYNSPLYLRSAFRGRNKPENRNYDFGFRVVRTLD
jgi:formylglycine-generating enzyme required for sulfatase activity